MEPVAMSNLTDGPHYHQRDLWEFFINVDVLAWIEGCVSLVPRRSEGLGTRLRAVSVLSTMVHVSRKNVDQSRVMTILRYKFRK